MNSIDNNQFEVKPNTKSKRKITTPCPNAYLNPGLDILANEDRMCNTAMEIPIKKRKRSKSCDIAAFENRCLDAGITKAAINEFLIRELDNVRKNLRTENPEDAVKCATVYNETSFNLTTNKENFSPENETITIEEASVLHNVKSSLSNSLDGYNKSIPQQQTESPIYANTTDLVIYNPSKVKDAVTNTNPQQHMELTLFQPDLSHISVLEQKSILTENSRITADDVDSSVNSYIQKSVTNQVIINNSCSNLSFIDRLALDSPNPSNQSLYLDDDLNESNIMEIKTITIITKKKRIVDKKKNTNPFLDPNLNDNFTESTDNPFLAQNMTKPELEYNDVAMDMPTEANVPHGSSLMPRRLFIGDTNSTISTLNESMNTDHHEYENIDSYRCESPIYENISGEMSEPHNKQSKILGHDVSRFNAIDIMNLNKNSDSNNSNASNDSKKDLKHQLLKASNKLSKKVLKTLKKTFKHQKVDHDITLNPYEVPRKLPKPKPVAKEAGIENPGLNLDNSDEIEIEEIDDVEHQYETVKTIRNTQLNMNVTPLRERFVDNEDFTLSSRTNTPGKKVRFDSTLNQEKVITGNSFDYDIQSPGFDSKIEKYHDELENCINERKFIQQNM